MASSSPKAYKPSSQALSQASSVESSLQASFWHEVIDTHPLTASGQTRLGKAIALLTAHPTAGCLIALHRKKVVGIATRQDLMAAMAQNPNWPKIRLSTVMSRPVVTVTPSAAISTLSSLITLLQEHQISYLPVVDERGYLLGLVEQSRLLRKLQLHRDHPASVDTASAYHPQRAQIFADITLKIRQSLQLKEILQTTVDEIQQLLKADRVLIYQVFPDSTGKTISEAVVEPYPSILEIPFPEEVFPETYQTLYAQGRVRAITDVHAPHANLSECLVEFIDQWCIKSKLIVPIVHPITPPATPSNEAAAVRKNLWGLLIAHQCARPRQWSDFELDLMQQLAGQVGLALSQGQLMEYLEDRVKLRTAELTKANLSLKKEINDRQKVSQALSRSEAQLRLVTNNLPVLIAYVDSQQCYQFNNKSYEQWLGRAPNKIHGQTMQAVVGEAHYQKIRPHIEAALAGQQVSYEGELTFKDGRDRSVSVTYIPHIEAAPQKAGQKAGHKTSKKKIDSRPATVKGFFALTTDISDRKAIERMKDEFIAVVSHELRTPLTSIHTSLKLLATGRLGDLKSEGQEMLTVADENTDRLVRLVNNVLDLQRIEAGEVTMDAHVCDTAALIEQTVETMQTIAQQHDIKIETQAESLPIWADPDYIIQTLTNLVGNAIKFSPPGNQVYLSVQKYPQTSSKTASETQYALFCVQDSGQGIPTGQLASIFERFQQVDSSDSRKKGGTGLGLTICRKVVEQHGGKIWAESQLGQGSHFYFTIPLSANAVP
ncbi:MAG: ATP-binding protein [Cyanobacteria bacterium J06560_5]